MVDEAHSTNLWPLAAAFWERECLAAGADPNDARLVGSICFAYDEPDFLGLAGAPMGSDGARWLAERYVSGLPRSVRSAHGRFYTPRSLASILVERALQEPIPEEGVIVDPACGAGSLLTAATEILVATRPPEDAVRTVVGRLRGTDLDPVAARLCELAVRVALLPAWMAIPDSQRPAIPRLATVTDGLADTAPAALVLANPPFGRRRLSAEQRLRHAPVLYGHAHLPSLFLHAAVERLSRGGVAAFVVPTSVVGGAYYQRLREFLIKTAPPQWLAFIDDRSGVFTGDVLQEALLGVFVRGRRSLTVSVRRVGSSPSFGGAEHVVSRASWVGKRPWLIARDPDDVSLVAAATARKHRLSDYGWKVSTGPLVWNRHRDQLFPRNSRGRIPVIWASDVRPEGVDPFESRPGRFIEPRSGQEWLALTKPAILVQRTTAPEQPRRIIAGVLDEGTLEELGGCVVVENHLNICTWSGEGILTHERLHDYLMSEEADRLYRCMSGSVAVSAFELGELPLPPPEDFSSEDERARRAA
ncbi:MAG: N-6 DNA methylase [Gaiellaceae bacterium]